LNASCKIGTENKVELASLSSSECFDFIGVCSEHTDTHHRTYFAAAHCGRAGNAYADARATTYANVVG
jgi:hypothetical protein